MIIEWDSEDETKIEQISIYFSDLNSKCQEYLESLISNWDNKDEILSNRYPLGSLDAIIFQNMTKYK